jgi:hypothetical protein
MDFIPDYVVHYVTHLFIVEEENRLISVAIEIWREKHVHFVYEQDGTIILKSAFFLVIFHIIIFIIIHLHHQLIILANLHLFLPSIIINMSIFVFLSSESAWL